jgi:urease accessory protein
MGIRIAKMTGLRQRLLHLCLLHAAFVCECLKPSSRAGADAQARYNFVMEIVELERLGSQPHTVATPDDLERAVGKLALAVDVRGGRDAIADLHQSGCGRFLFPARAKEQPVEAVVVNTAGGLTGGDRFEIKVSVGEGARAILATQACEKIYASSGTTAKLSTVLKVQNGAKLCWLPQETILFDHSALERSLTIDMANTANVLAGEAILLGRQAMGEELTTARFRDRWRIRRDGRLVFAEESAIGGAEGDWPAVRGSRALLGETTTALATIMHASPGAESRLDSVRAIMESTGIDGGASAFDGLLVMRMVAPSGLVLRKTLLPLLEHCMDGRLPRVWMT